MINLEVRKQACAVLGWTRFEDYHNGGGFWHKNGCMEHQRGSTCKCGGHWCLPEVEHDPAVSEPMFLEWCAKNGHQWQLSSTQKRQAVCVILLGDPNSNNEVNVVGSDPSEARARAIVAASQVEGK